MRFASASGEVARLDAEFPVLLQRAETALGATPDLAFLFFSSHFEDEARTIVDLTLRRYPEVALAGCSAEGVIGAEGEHEGVPAISVLLARLPGVRIQPFHVGTEEIDEFENAAQWRTYLGVDPASAPSFFFFGDPFTVAINPVLEAFDQAYPQRPVLGGMASGCEAPGQSVLVAGTEIYREGCAGIALSGPIQLDAVVSQGCRPIGRPLVITKCENNILHGLGGKPAFARLREILEQLPERDAKLAQQALFIGRVINEYQESFGRGDFLIRHLLGYDPKSGALAVGDQLRVGATVQFHVRDADSADEDLRQMLAPFSGDAAPAGVLLFSCNGRGTRMWSQPHHDVTTLQQVCGQVPVAGFFAAGEIGPVAGRNFIHGHTASLALMRPLPEGSA